MKRYGILLFGVVFLLLVAAPRITLAHCQVPCGIYDDDARFAMMLEHVTTIEKSISEIKALSNDEDEDENQASEALSDNQLVRWVNNKDQHADELSEIVTYYFMAQRVKPVDKSNAEGHQKYLEQLEMLHNMVVYAMKCKQTVDTTNTDKLRQLIKDFKVAYLGHE